MTTVTTATTVTTVTMVTTVAMVTPVTMMTTVTTMTTDLQQQAISNSSVRNVAMAILDFYE